MVGEFGLHLVFPLDSARCFPLPEHLEAASKIVVELASCQSRSIGRDRLLELFNLMAQKGG